MLTFRGQLRSARREYTSARYPGDLAADVLSGEGSTRANARAVRRSRRLWVGLLGAGALTAAAASLAFTLWRLPAAPVAAPPQIAKQSSVPGRPLALGLAPEWPSAVAVPAVPLGRFPRRPGAAPSVGRLTPPGLPGGRIVPTLGGPDRAAVTPSTQESV